MKRKSFRLVSGFLTAAFMAASFATLDIVHAQSTATMQTDTAPLAPATPKIDTAAMTEWRRDIHSHPETAYEEVRTAAKIDSLLRSWGIETHTNIGKTGVVGILKGGNAASGSPSMCLRADIDALPITSIDNGLPYISKTPGKTHACGHDGHTAMLLGAAKYLSETKNFNGTVYFIFQPAEEGGAGAKAMIDDGLFDIVKCDGIYGMHAWPGLPAGKIGVAEGNITASADSFTIKINGKGGHAAYPADNIDVISMASDIVIALHKFKEEAVPEGEDAVLAITMLHGGETFNTMPEKVELGGTIRTFSNTTQDKIEKAIKDVSEHYAALYGAKVKAEYKRGYPSVYNSPLQTSYARAAASDLLGKDNVADFKRTMGGEDFSYYLERVPGAFIGLGQWDGKSPKTQLHSPYFDFNDATLEIGTGYWIKLIESRMPVAQKQTPPTPPVNAP